MTDAHAAGPDHVWRLDLPGGTGDDDATDEGDGNNSWWALLARWPPHLSSCWQTNPQAISIPSKEKTSCAAVADDR